MVQFQQRRGTAANLAAANETPAAGQIIFEYDTNKMKIGDGETAYNSLEYIVSSDVVLTTDSRLSDARTPTSHNHDDRYYTEAEADGLLAAKAATTHTHVFRDLTDVNTSVGAVVGPLDPSRWYLVARNETVDDWSATTAGIIQVGSVPLQGGWPVGSLGATLASKADSNHNHDSRYYTESEVDSLLASKAASSHAHDDRYYTETEVDTLLSAKAASSHTHDDRYYTEADVDILLSAKAASSHTHDDRYYTEAEVDTLIAGASAVTDGNKGEITVSNSGATWQINSGVLKVGSNANKPIITTANGTLVPSSFGTGANTFTEGNDLRICKAYVRFDGSNLAVSSHYNISSISSAATGQYAVNFLTGIGSANYTAIAFARTYNNSFGGIITSDVSSTASGTAEVRVYDSYSGQVNNSYICLVVFG